MRDNMRKNNVRDPLIVIWVQNKNEQLDKNYKK